jgi:transposase-like protein
VTVIIHDVRNLISRWCNEAAHVIAKQDDVFKDVIWFNEPPDTIRNIIYNERLV